MSFDWKHLVEVSRLLEYEAKKAPNRAEALHRSAVGRAYYGAYCYARNYAEKYLGYVVKDFGDDHGALRNHLKKSRRAGDASRLDALRQMRNEADYSGTLLWHDVETTVQESIAAAERIFASLTPPSGVEPKPLT